MGEDYMSVDEPLVESLNLRDGHWHNGPNPCTQNEFTLYRETFQLGPLDQDELDIFKAQFITLLASPGSEERRLMLKRLRAYVLTLRAVKQSLNNVKFTGLNPEMTELGFGHIRPVFTQVNGVVKTTWTVALTTAYADWFDTAGGVGYLIGNSFGMCVTHLKSLVTPTPFMAECQFTVSRTGVMIPIDVRGLQIGDTINQVSIVPIPTMVLIPRATFYAQARSDILAANNDFVALGGLVFGLGTALNSTTVYPTA